MHHARTVLPVLPTTRRRRGWIAVAIIVAAAVADRSGWLLVPARSDHAVYDLALGRVTGVIDGDTIDVDISDDRHGRPTTRVRLIGIDAPELTTPDGRREPGAERAAWTLREAAVGRLVRLRLEPGRTRDRWGRLLAHAERPSGELLAETVLRAGLAVADERSPHRHLTRLARAEAAARRHARGIWGEAPP